MRKTVVALMTMFAFAAFTACGSDDPATSAAPDGGAVPAPDGGSGGADASSNDAASSSDAADGDGGDGATCTPPSTPPRVLFLNKSGGVYTPGPDDSRTNVSMIVDTSTSVTAWSVTPAAWTAILDCVKQKLSPFNVTVTDVDPGTSTQHVEVVFAPTNANVFNGAKSVGPLTCSVDENAIAFVSQPHAEANATNGCAAAAQLYGFAMGLEPVTSCPDAMTFDYAACTTAAFTNTPISCGATSPMDCACGTGTTQNSFAEMLAVLGPRCL